MHGLNSYYMIKANITLALRHIFSYEGGDSECFNYLRYTIYRKNVSKLCTKDKEKIIFIKKL